jgi:trimethylamine--corrinoid protein Co-methyltransferase
MTIKDNGIQPICSAYRTQFISDNELDLLQASTLQVLAEVGIRFPTEKALRIFSDHGAHVDWETQIVKLPTDLVQAAMDTVPRYFKLGGREPELDLQLQDGVSYWTTDGCGFEVIDFETRQRRASTKQDVGRMARVADYLSSMAFYWPMVSAQDYGELSPLHELDATWNNSLKHIQTETLMGEPLCRYALEMGAVIAGGREELRRRPSFSLLLCTIAPLVQDREGLEGAMFLAEAGIPVGFMAMPTLGTTAPATHAGALVVGDAEIISGTVLLQLINPGTPVYHSLLPAWADPRSGAYVGYPLNSKHVFAAVEMAHHWGMPTLAGAFGTDSAEPGTWQAAAEVALHPYILGLMGAEMVTGIGLNETYTLLYPEAIILDDELYHRARYSLQEMQIDAETMALEAIRAVGPGGHFLREKHTREHMPEGMVPGLAHQMDKSGGFRDPVEVAREKAAWILKNHHPQPLEQAKRVELERILGGAEAEFGVT